MGQIRVMPEALANQIAAGEVVERPASCVKELIENSLDAGATQIDVEIEDGGIKAIRVQDNGCGMDEEDAVLCFSRHATSKVAHARDLFHIRTLGFRGEALAAIAAVARVRLSTRKHDAEFGTQLRIEGTDLIEPPSPKGMPPGTRIEVEDLFFNTPARLKYLRTVATEQARCVEVVQKAALGRPDVSFRCTAGGHVVFQSPGSGRLLDAIAALYGVGEAKQFLPFETKNADYHIKGFIGRPTQAKSNRAHGHLFVNGRPIRNVAIHQAICAGYGARLMVNRHPMYVIDIVMDPTLVDVNIHPHKSEVRFSEERELCLLIQQTIRECLDAAFLVATVRFPENESKTAGSSNQPFIREKPLQTNLGDLRGSVGWMQRPTRWTESTQRALDVALADPTKDARAGLAGADTQPGIETAFEASDASDDHPNVADVRSVDASSREGSVRVAEEASAGRTGLQPSVPDTVAPEPSVETRPIDWKLRPIGQALGMYILADDGEHLYIIDQHAAHERVLYEKFYRRMNERTVRRVPLLMPISLGLSPTEYTSVMSKQSTLGELGIEIEAFGGYDVIVRTVPDVWEGLDVGRLLDEVVHALPELDRHPDVAAVLRDQIVMKACKAAIKANWTLSSIEMEALCQALTELEDPFHCPHGRPVFIRLSSRDLEKEFRRIV
jgi:DNA mismatch repair protein MutL